MAESTPPQVESERVVIATLDDDVFTGTLDDVVGFLVQLRQRFEQDYQDLALDADRGLTGVRHYSDATVSKLQQLRDLLDQLPEEAANEILRSCTEDTDR